MQREEKTIRRTKEKVTTLLLALFLIVLSVIGTVDWYSVGIYAGSPWTGRGLYPFFHASVFHAILNAWCLCCVMFIYDITVWRLLLAYIVAVTYPVDTVTQLFSLPITPTVGISGCLFFLLGSIAFEVRRRLYYQTWMFFYLIVGFFLPYTNAWIHLYCYLCGIILSLLNYPIKRCKRKR